MEFILKSNYGEYIEKAKVLYEKYQDRITIPSDLAWVEEDKRLEACVGSIPKSAALTDIGSKTAKQYAGIIKSSKTVFVNGPMGIFEQAATEHGTKEIWNALGETEAYTVLGGGDSIAATQKYNLTDKISYICTGGGALIRFLAGEELPVVKALRQAAKTFG